MFFFPAGRGAKLAAKNVIFIFTSSHNCQPSKLSIYTNERATGSERKVKGNTAQIRNTSGLAHKKIAQIQIQIRIQMGNGNWMAHMPSFRRWKNTAGVKKERRDANRTTPGSLPDTSHFLKVSRMLFVLFSSLAILFWLA